MAADLFESRTIDAPYIAIGGRQRSAIRDQLQPFPRKCQLDCPAAVRVRAAVDDTVHMYRGFQPREIPIEKSPTLAPRMHVAAHAIEHHDACARGIELRPPVITPAWLVNVFPDPEGFINRVERVDFELVIKRRARR